MTEWELAAAIVAAAILPCLGICALAGVWDALAAVELASVLLTSVLLLLCEAFHRQPFVDLALTFAFVSALGALVFARLMEKEL